MNVGLNLFVRGWLLAILVSFVVAASACNASTRLAVVVGNSQYQHESSLKNPRSDARLVAKALREQGAFNTVIERYDLDRRAMFALIKDIEQQGAGRDAIVFYFAGHGMQGRDGQNYLVPVDAQVGDASDLRAEAVPVAELLDAIRVHTPRVGLVVLDACRTTRNVRGASARGLARMNVSGGNLLVAYAAESGTAAEDGNGENSPYALAFAESLKLRNLSVLAQLDEVAKRVRAATNNRQRPTRDGDLEARHSLVESVVASVDAQSQATMSRPPGLLPTTSALVGDIAVPDEDTSMWAVIKDQRDKQSFVRYLARYPNGKYRTVALERTRGLSRTSSGCIVAGAGGDSNGNTLAWDGKCVNGLAQGSGTLTVTKGTDDRVTLKGTLQDGVRVGTWTQDFSESKLFREATGSQNPQRARTMLYDRLGDVQSRQSFVMKNGDNYEGETDATAVNPQGPPHGRGSMTYADGARYIGTWQRGVLSGMGELRFPSSDGREKVVGEFQNGAANGKVTLTYRDGIVYVGQAKNYRRWGYGELSYPSQAKLARYVGDFEDDAPHGTGVLTWRDGSRYEGEFRSGKFHGMGKYFDSSGMLKYEGPHVEGKATGPARR